jgi:hypothetical protein
LRLGVLSEAGVSIITIPATANIPDAPTGLSELLCATAAVPLPNIPAQPGARLACSDSHGDARVSGVGCRVVVGRFFSDFSFLAAMPIRYAKRKFRLAPASVPCKLEGSFLYGRSSFASSATLITIMAGSDKDSPAAQEGGLDLNALSQLDFGPNWATGRKESSSGGKGKPFASDRGQRSAPDKGRGGRPDRRDSKGRPPYKGGSGERSFGDRGRGDSRRGSADQRHAAAKPVEAEFVPIVEVNFYPQDDAFDALVARLRANYRTYELFELVRLILAKPERMVVAVAALADVKSGGKRSLMYYSVPDNLPFLEEDAAVEHVMANYLDRFFSVETVEVEPPKGNFVVVQRCGVTGELLGPPNYHRYAGFVQEHFSKRINGMSFERFQAKIETLKDPESVSSWIEKMKQGFRYTEILPEVESAQNPEAGEEAGESAPVREAAVFDDRDAVKRYLLNHRKADLIGSAEWIRMDGKALEALPAGPLKRSIETVYEKQKRFPLETANNVRGRLRRENFTIYKRGSKGASMVCAVKRKFRDPKTVFSDSIIQLIGFIEEHPMVHAHDLPERFLGLEPMKMPVPVAKDIDEDEHAVAKTSEPTLKPEDAQRLLELSRDLKWLVSEGYVSEYGDGRLFVHPPATVVKAKEKVKESKPKAAVGKKAQAPVVPESTDTKAEPEKPQPSADSANPDTAAPDSQPET